MSYSRIIPIIASASLFACGSDAQFSDIAAPQFSAEQFMLRIPIEESAVTPVPAGCTGEPVAWEFRQEILFRSTIDAQGGFHGSFLFHDKGTRGVGVETGMQYRIGGAQTETFNVAYAGLPVTNTAIFTRNFVSQGSLPNLRVHNVFHFTINANGELVSSRSTFSTTCR